MPTDIAVLLQAARFQSWRFLADLRFYVQIQCFSEFFTRNVISYHKPWMPVHFVGSLADNFADELKETAEALGMTIGKIETSPMRGLIDYHSSAS